MLNVLLAAPSQGGGGNPMGSFLIFGGMIVVMYFFMIRPQTKKAKQQKQFIESLKEGEKVVTIAGIHGKIKKVNDDGTLVIEVGPGTFLTMERSAISMEYTSQKNTPPAAPKA
ncbi:preprotein translocase subunit YajC [Chitinophaga sp. Hz27]|uniref:preprotein translocase subunit YajC n=1 Tax=Chitinophaga sp. Hz27 TaxID=3347169 RepID=UPI0035D9D61B